MDLFISTANAQGAEQSNPFGFFLPLLVIFGAFYFLLIRPQHKKQKAHTALIAGLQVGDEILTAGGVLGKISAVSDHYAVVKISENTEIKVQKSSVSMVVPKGTYDEA